MSVAIVDLVKNVYCSLSVVHCSESANVSYENEERKLENVYKPWAPGGYVAFRLLLAARMCAALWSNISDCDETYNYWEPVRLIPV